MQETTHALKEWQVAVDALEKGETVMLLRKGGIREVGGKFSVAHDRVVLYPTYEHQKPDLLKPAYSDLVEPVEPGWHPQSIPIKAWATITDTFRVSDFDRVNALMPFHIWNEKFIHDRLKWKPNQPLYILLLKVYRLASPKIISRNPVYGGCKSWIDLQEEFPLDGTPVQDDQTYFQQVAKIRSIIG
jgi:hypothetical protein